MVNSDPLNGVLGVTV